MKDNLSLQNLKRRMTGETPSFFKRIKKLGAIIGAIGLAIVGFPALIPKEIIFTMPTWLIVIGTAATSAGTLMATVSSLAVADNSEAD